MGSKNSGESTPVIEEKDEDDLTEHPAVPYDKPIRRKEKIPETYSAATFMMGRGSEYSD